MTRKLLIVIMVLVALVLLLIATRPGTYTVDRSTTVAAPPAVVYGLVADFHRWAAWSPWTELDPAMKVDIGGPDGAGATYRWEGNSRVGSGKMTIAKLEPGREVVIDVEFLAPAASTARADFLFQPAAGGTRVLWRMTGHNSFAAKASTLVMNVDQLVGKDLEHGLSQLKATAEAAEAAAPPATDDVPAAVDAGAP